MAGRTPWGQRPGGPPRIDLLPRQLVEQRVVRRQRTGIGAGFPVLLALLGLWFVLESRELGRAQDQADQERAAILALGHSFIVQNYDEGAQLGTITVNGVIAQKWRGPVGTSGGTGYLKGYGYDSRMRYASPPYVQEITETDYRVSQWAGLPRSTLPLASAPMLRYLTAGESHGRALVAVLEGLPAGVPLTTAEVAAELARRRLGYGRGKRMRFEEDRLEVLGGLRHGRTLGSPLAIRIDNSEWPKWTEVMSPDPVE